MAQKRKHSSIAFDEADKDLLLCVQDESSSRPMQHSSIIAEESDAETDHLLRAYAPLFN